MGTNINSSIQKDLKSIQEIREVMDAFRKIVRSLRNSSHQSHHLSGLTSAQFFILQRAKGQKDLTINKLADLTFTHQSTVSELVSRLIFSGYISKKKSKHDARQSVISLTKKGQTILRSSLPTAQEYLAQSISYLTQKKRLQLLKLLTEIVSHAQFYDQKPTLFFEDPTGTN